MLNVIDNIIRNILGWSLLALAIGLWAPSAFADDAPAIPASPQIQPVVTEHISPVRYKSWREMCRYHRCGAFPIYFVTANFGDAYQYFPMRRLTNPAWKPQAIGPDNTELLRFNLAEKPNAPRRGFSNLSLSMICCNELFSWFGLHASEDENINRLAIHPQSLQTGSSYVRNSLSRIVFGMEGGGMVEIDPPDIPEELRKDVSALFWRLKDSYGDAMFVSKVPVLSSHYVVMRCRLGVRCDVMTLRPAKTSPKHAPHMSLTLYAPVGKGGAFVANSLQDVAAFFGRIDEMMRLARVHPKKR